MADDPTENDEADYQASLEAARGSGWSWSDIWNHINGATAAAADAGYTQSEIDKHLGFVDPKEFEHNVRTNWASATAADAGPPIASDYAAAIKNGEVKGPRDFSERYLAAAPDIDPAELAQKLPTREDLADATVALGGGANVRDNLLDHWAGTGQKPIDAAVAAHSDNDLADKLLAPENEGLLGEAWKGMLRAGTGTVIGLSHIGEAAFTSLANITGSETLRSLITEKAAEWKDREDRWNAELKGTDWSQAGTSPAHFVAGVLGQAVPTIAEYLAAGVPAMITYGVLHGANEAYRQTGSAAAAAAGAIIGGAEAGAPAPFLHGAAGKNMIDMAVRGAVGMGLVGGLQTLADPIPRAIATGDYQPPSWEGIEQGVVEGAIGGGLFGAFGAARQHRAVMIDTRKAPGETETEMSAREAFAPVRVAEIETPTGADGEQTGPARFSPASTPAERIEWVTQNSGHTPAELENGHAYQDALARMGETDPATVELAKGHDTAWAELRYLRGLMGDLLTNTEGSIPRLTEGEREELARQQAAFGGRAVEPPAPEAKPASRAEPQLPGGGGTGAAFRAQPAGKNAPTGLDLVLRESEQAALRQSREPRRPDSTSGEQRAPEAPPPEDTRATTNLMRDTIIKHQSLGEQNVLHFAGLVDAVRHLINPHMPEFEAALKDGDPMGTTIGRLMQDMEGRGEVTVPGSGGQRFVAMIDKNDPLRPVVDLFKTINTEIWLNIQDRVARGQIDSVGYVRDYWRHLWADPNQAEAAWGAGRQGSNASMKARTLPTISDGLALGLALKIPHPADLMNYDVASKLKYLHHLDMIDDLENKSGVIVRSIRAPFPGAEQIMGRSTDRISADGIEHAWAPAGAARLYNRTIESGWYAYPSTASTYQKLMWLKNTSVATKLIFPVFHSFVIAEQTLASGMQLAMSELRAGNVGTAARYAAETVTVAPMAARVARAGQAAIKAYADRTGDEVVQGLVEAGARYGKRQFAYQASAQGAIASIMQNKGHLLEAAGRELAREARSTLGDGTPIGAADILKRGAMFVPRVAGVGVNELGRVTTTLSAPLFDYAIPTMKAGASYLRAKQFMDLNPTASEEMVKTRLRQINENIEDRFGEMNQDNLLWNKWLKQTANAASISTSWAYGTWRWLASGSGYNLERGVEWNPEATTSLISAVAVYAGANALFNYLNTGERPKDIWDLLNFRTGGVTAKGKPQRGLLPTEFKELYDMGRIAVDGYLDPWSVPKGIMHYIAGKENPAVQIFNALVTGEDAVGHKISQTPRGWTGYFEDQVKPIVFTNLEKSPPGGGINAVERTFIREAPSWLQDPQNYVATQQSLHDRWAKEELQRAGREAIQSGQEPPEGYKTPGSGRGPRGNGTRTHAQRVNDFLNETSAQQVQQTLAPGRGSVSNVRDRGQPARQGSPAFEQVWASSRPQGQDTAALRGGGYRGIPPETVVNGVSSHAASAPRAGGGRGASGGGRGGRGRRR